MRSFDFWTDRTVPGRDPWKPTVRQKRVMDRPLVRSIARGSLSDRSDVEVAVALARFAHEEFEDFATDGADIEQDDSIAVIRALMAVLERLGISTFDPPFRDFEMFKKYWKREGMAGSGGWDKRRRCLEEHFGPLHEVLAAREAGSISSTLATAVSSDPVTGWSRVDEEISELRRHFESASSPQDYSNVGNDCVSTLEALSAAAYDHSVHQLDDEPAPPVANTKTRLDRVIEVDLAGNAELRKLARASIEAAQAVKHRRKTTTRMDAGISADAVILLAHILRRIREV
ncbi:hypothetical protein [Gordonia sp. SMJS1]|uniref:hypothetical protein n=1 Tax=Gordonia sp. SMJS1 TaxID=3039400 RepID=UPI0024564A56|nr:hypothetical protein [Gordonia sp. SMJS1]WGJ88208.1 hypothetical protein QAD21_24805 [Gordonia sp. SMJS1]